MSHDPLFSIVTAALTIMGGERFPTWPFPPSLEVSVVEEPRSKDEKLSHAVGLLIPAALERKQGILVIERDYGQYTIRVDQGVPCGVTQESRGGVVWSPRMPSTIRGDGRG
ncbi:hypothetical protein [Arthrobacter sp. NtRootA1]|uniref:hypothetical protein n=1 Tax=Arthrobacter sp. NtRootA1 TaxID=2830983 RepID=UPI001CC73090|nr:hypothetical protein [Arthrobacter sp. NtRootA1]BCW05913.1 hypothetical protein NtRootA1_20510 [Arthrobacter sp. NtRootA1]